MEEVGLSASPGRPPSKSPVLFSSEEEEDADETNQAAVSLCNKVLESLQSPEPQAHGLALSEATEEPENSRVSLKLYFQDFQDFSTPQIAPLTNPLCPHGPTHCLVVLVQRLTE